MKSYLINACEKYIEALEALGLGFSELEFISVNRIAKELDFTLGKSTASIGIVVLKIKDQLEFIIEDFTYNSHKKRLKFKIPNDALAPLADANLSEDVKIYSDMSFLSKRIISLLKHPNHPKIALPSYVDSELISSLDLATTLADTSLDPAQVHAIEHILTHPLSYIWGPPGSGKTQAVMFNALKILFYYGERSIILAPTNKALDLALATIINQFDKIGINRANVLRLGFASRDFMSNYSECLDPSSLDDTSVSIFDNKDLKSRIKEASIIGATIDGFIAKAMNYNFDYRYLFIDECAYMSLNKAICVFSKDVNISLFGDHKQLSPVCELKDDLIETNPYFKCFSKSSIYTAPFIHNFYAANPDLFAPIKLDNITSPLTHSYRYGDNLARILDQFIYKIGLTGTTNHLKIYYLNVKSTNPINSKSNPAEAKAIKKLTHTLSSDYMVLTPFKDQIKELLKERIDKSNISTIHTSQGNEYSCVILSVVSLHYHLTNSDNKSALYALNVAISRAKNQFILVLDRDFWLQRSGQFICELLKLAQEIKLNKE